MKRLIAIAVALAFSSAVFAQAPAPKAATPATPATPAVPAKADAKMDKKAMAAQKAADKKAAAEKKAAAKK